MNELSPELLRRAADKAKEKGQQRTKKFSAAADKKAPSLSFYVDGELKTYKTKEVEVDNVSVTIKFIEDVKIVIYPRAQTRDNEYVVISTDFDGDIKFDKLQQRAIADYLNNKKIGIRILVDKWDFNLFPRL
jgi:hypothetical protein